MRRQGTGGERKAPKRSQFARVLVVGTLILSTNEGRIGRKNEPNFLPAAQGAGREKSSQEDKKSGQGPVASGIEEAETTVIEKAPKRSQLLVMLIPGIL